LSSTCDVEMDDSVVVKDDICLLARLVTRQVPIEIYFDIKNRLLGGSSLSRVGCVFRNVECLPTIFILNCVLIGD